MVLDQQVSAVGTVVWATDIDPLTVEVGIQFEEIDARGQALLADFEWQSGDDDSA